MPDTPTTLELDDRPDTDPAPVGWLALAAAAIALLIICAAVAAGVSIS